MMNRQAQAWGLKNTSFKNVTGLTEPGHQQHGARHGGDRRAHHQRLPRVLPVLLDQGIQVQQHRPAEPQPAAAPRPDRRRHEDRLHRGGGLLPARDRAARVPEPRPGRRRRQAPDHDRRPQHDLDGSARQREPEAPELGLPGVRHGAPVRRRQADRHAAGLEGHGQRRQARRRAARSSSACRRARATSCRPRSSAPTRWSRRSPRASASARILVATAAGAPVADVPLVALEPVEQSGIFGRAWDAIRLWIK